MLCGKNTVFPHIRLIWPFAGYQARSIHLQREVRTQSSPCIKTTRKQSQPLFFNRRHSKMSSNVASQEIPSIIKQTQQAASGIPGEQREPRQVMTTEDMHPNPANSIKLPPNRQKLLDDVIALYSCEPTIERVSRYAPACVYDDQFVYANDRYKMAGQWFALPKLFKSSVNEGYEVIKNEPNLIQFKNEQTWEFLLIHKKATINALVSLELDPATADSDFPLILYHKDQANEKDYSHEGFGFAFKKLQADTVMKIMSDPNVKYFKGDENAAKEPVRKYGSGENAPLKDL